MTTSYSSLNQLQRQADKIASMIKAFERGEPVEPRFAQKIRIARDHPTFKVGIVMDDKLITIEIPWSEIHSMGEVNLSAFILRLMRGQRETTH